MYDTIFVAGTFDGIHKGHVALLSRAFTEGKRVTIGLTSDKFVRKFKIYNLQFSNNENSLKISNFKLKIRGYEERKKELEDWLTKNNFTDKASIIPIDDPYEPAASIVNVDALVVSSETRKRGEEINRKREERGLTKLILLEVPMVPSEDQKTLSSSRVRSGEVDVEGRLTMPDNLRPELQKPLGRLLTAVPNEKFVITVGDVTTKAFLDSGQVPNLMIIDRKVGRIAFPDVVLPRNARIVHVQSGPGFVSKKAIRVIRETLEILEKKPSVIEVEGEEDLLTLPAIVEAPVGSFVYYGQPGRGVVEVAVTEEKKREVKLLLQKFLSR